ncbi:MAG: Fic family protein [Acidimicrobiales bacterium]
MRSFSADKVAEMRRRAQAIAEESGLKEAGRRTNRMIGAALQTQSLPTASPLLSARQTGVPYDPAREQLFDRLHDALQASAPMTIIAWADDAERRATLPFWEAYFSNFIEGTEFTVDEAVAIVYDNRIPAGRPLDAHDIVDTYRVLADDTEMSQRPSTFAEFEETLLRRHRRIMLARPDVGPGAYKESPNRAGTTLFVAPELVRGTLLRGWDRLSQLANPVHRAFFAMFLVAEVHPFADGNGRTARIMMNSELHAAGEGRAIIPIVYRNEYLDALRRLSREGDPGLLLRVLDFGRRYTAAIDFSAIDVSRQQLDATNAFISPDEALTRGRYLTIPGAADSP